jgi:hypothetical protein
MLQKIVKFKIAKCLIQTKVANARVGMDNIPCNVLVLEIFIRDYSKKN